MLSLMVLYIKEGRNIYGEKKILDDCTWNNFVLSFYHHIYNYLRLVGIQYTLITFYMFISFLRKWKKVIKVLYIGFESILWVHILFFSHKFFTSQNLLNFQFSVEHFTYNLFILYLYQFYYEWNQRIKYSFWSIKNKDSTKESIFVTSNLRFKDFCIK